MEEKGTRRGDAGRTYALRIHTAGTGLETVFRILGAYAMGRSLLEEEGSTDTEGRCVEKAIAAFKAHVASLDDQALVRGLETLPAWRRANNDGAPGEPDVCELADDDLSAMHLFLARKPTKAERRFLEARIRGFPDAWKGLSGKKRPLRMEIGRIRLGKITA